MKKAGWHLPGAKKRVARRLLPKLLRGGTTSPANMKGWAGAKGTGGHPAVKAMFVIRRISAATDKMTPNGDDLVSSQAVELVVRVIWW